MVIQLQRESSNGKLLSYITLFHYGLYPIKVPFRAISNNNLHLQIQSLYASLAVFP